MNTLAYLYKEAVRVAEMIEGTNISFAECVKQDGCIYKDPRNFTCSPDTYEFALAIVEGKPVFVGDVLYGNITGTPYIINGSMHPDGINNSNYSWNPPKPKTVMIELTREDAEYWIECGRANHWDNSTAYVAASKNFFHAIKKALEK